jgi:hypothetical protein
VGNEVATFVKDFYGKTVLMQKSPLHTPYKAISFRMERRRNEESPRMNRSYLGEIIHVLIQSG